MAGRLAFLAVLASPTLLLAIVLIIIVMAAGAAGADPAAMGNGQTVSCAVTAQGQQPDAATKKLLDELWPIYAEASDKYQLAPRGPSILAAINMIETDLGRNATVSSKGATGWMQFMPDTWRTYGVDASGDGRADPANKRDAIFSAANYLKASGAPGNWHDAIFAYNHAEWYVKNVTDQADALDGHCSTPSVGGASSMPSADGYRATLKPDGTVEAKGVPPIVKKIIDAANQIANKPYGPDVGGGHPPSDKIDETYDCSGATMWILRKAGLLDYRNWVAADFMTYGEEVKPGDAAPWVTVLANQDHVFMIIAGLRYDVENPRRVGPAWHNDSRTFDGFAARRPAGM
jgi:hypothetical protein